MKKKNNFHSGMGCQIITSFHNYDSGNAVPYDDSFISKDVTILLAPIVTWINLSVLLGNLLLIRKLTTFLSGS